MNELQYKLSNLERKLESLTERKLAVYGTGVNARRVLGLPNTQNVIGLMDAAREGETVYGLHVFSTQEILQLGVDCIIMAANVAAAEAIYQRISAFCRENGILLLDMGGGDEIALRNAIEYQAQTEKRALLEECGKKVQEGTRLILPLETAICIESTDFYDKVWDIVAAKALFAGFDITHFKRHRSRTRELAENNTTYELDEEYQILREYTAWSSETVAALCQLEKETILEKLSVDDAVAELVRSALAAQTGVCILTTLTIEEERLRQFLQEKGIAGDFEIRRVRWKNMNFPSGELREMVQAEGGTPCIYMDSNRARLLAALKCGAQVCLLHRVAIPKVSVLLKDTGIAGQREECLRLVRENTDGVSYEILDAENREAAKGAYGVFLRSDCKVQFDWLSPLVRLLEKHEEADAVVPQLVRNEAEIGKDTADCYVKEVSGLSAECYMERLTGKREEKKTVLYQPDSVVVCESAQKNPAVEKRQKAVLFISYALPVFDGDAGSRTIMFYLQMFVKRGYCVKFFPTNFAVLEPYVHMLQQMGIEVLVGTYWRKNIEDKIRANDWNISYAFLNYPDCAKQYIDLLQQAGIPTRYYGMDLHYLRFGRQYEISGDTYYKEVAEKYRKMETELIERCDVVYYPSTLEVDIVRKEFHKEQVRLLMISAYDMKKERKAYDSAKRSGIAFVGGYNHLPNVDAMLWFLHEIYPLVYKQNAIPFYMVGSNMPSELQNIEIPGVVKMGRLSDEELEELYGRIRMAVVPLRYGAGIKGKVVEAMYHGVPVVTTSIGAEGMPQGDARLEIADTAEEFSKKVLQLYDSLQELNCISESFEPFIEKYFSEEAAWKVIAEDFA